MMLQILLQEQAGKIVETSSYVLLNYGAIGAILVLCIAACVAMAISFKKQWAKQDERYFDEINKLRDQMSKYISEDRAQMLSTISEVTKAIHDIRIDMRGKN